MSVKPVTRWGVLWTSKSKLDGLSTHLMNEDLCPVLFATRKKARDYIERDYGYIRKRDDLRKEPHGWRMPKPVRVTVSMAT